MQNCSCSSFVAKQILVPRTTKSGSVSANMSSGLSRPSGTVTRKISTSKHSTSYPSHMRIIKQFIRNKKFSREVADHVSKARRASTRQVYEYNNLLQNHLVKMLKNEGQRVEDGPLPGGLRFES